MSIEAEFQILQLIMRAEEELEEAKKRGDERARRAWKQTLHELHERRRAVQDN